MCSGYHGVMSDMLELNVIRARTGEATSVCFEPRQLLKVSMRDLR